MDLEARIPEPELMDTPEQAAAYAAADFAEAHDALVLAFRERFPAFGSGRMVDIGCGPADVTVRLARAHPHVSVDGVDGDAEMLRHGRIRVEAAGLGERVRLDEVRLPAGPAVWAARGGYDAVVSTSLLHHLADPMALWTTVRAAASPAAAVFVWELRRPPTTDAAQALVDTYAGDEPEVLRADFYNSLCAAYTEREIQDQLAAAGLDLEVEPLGDRHLLIWGRAPG